MANPEHLEILKQGVDAWNKWREQNIHVMPDLSQANLEALSGKGINLAKANLSGTNLRGADLSTLDLHQPDGSMMCASLVDANLNNADLSWCNLTFSFLGNANLRYAVLEYTILRGSHLNNADFTGASISNVDLTHARLQNTWFGGAYLYGANFGNNDLSETLELDSVQHLGKSYLSINTIYLSQGKIPETFLRGCGLPDNLIVYIPSLLNDPLQFYSCFISYSSKDHLFTERLYADLQNKGVRCWFAPEDLKIGDRVRDRIDESIRLHDKLLIVLSENSVTSPWVSDEVESAIEREHREGRTVLFPIKIDDAVMESKQAWAATIRRTRHIGDFTRWKDHDSYSKAFDRLLRDLKAGDKQTAES